MGANSVLSIWGVVKIYIIKAGNRSNRFTATKNFLASFGMDSESLTYETVMDQARAGTLVAYMKEMGARGLTDKDMEILNRSLPRLNTSREARKAVAEVMIRNYDKSLKEFSHNYNTVMTNKPELAPITIKPLWLDSWEKGIPLAYSSLTSDPANSIVAAVIPYGKGKVITVGQNKIFEDSFLSKHDNLRWAQNMFDYSLLMEKKQQLCLIHQSEKYAIFVQIAEPN